MRGNYVHPFEGVYGTGSDHGALPEAKLWTQVILQAINDLHGRTGLAPHWAKDSAREWFASECDWGLQLYLGLSDHRCGPKFHSLSTGKETADEEVRRTCGDIYGSRSKSLEEKKLTAAGYVGSHSKNSAFQKTSSITLKGHVQ